MQFWYNILSFYHNIHRKEDSMATITIICKECREVIGSYEDPTKTKDKTEKSTCTPCANQKSGMKDHREENYK